MKKRLGKRYQLELQVDKPSYKAAVEAAVNTIYKRIPGYLLEDILTTLNDVNDTITERLHEVNHHIRRADGTTRAGKYEEKEHPLASGIAGGGVRGSHLEGTQGRPQITYVTTDYQHYRVPYGMAEHRRRTGCKGHYSTNPDHVPPQH